MRWNCATSIGLLVISSVSLRVVEAEKAGEGSDLDLTVVSNCVDRLLRQPSLGVTQQNELVVVLRIVDDECEATMHLTLTQKRQGDFPDLRVLLAYSNPDPEFSTADRVVDTSCPMIREKIVGDQAGLSEKLAQHLMKLRKASMPVVPEPVLWLHGIHYDIRIYSVHAASKYQFVAPGWPRLQDTELNQLDVWAQELLGMLGLSCEVSSAQSSQYADPG